MGLQEGAIFNSTERSLRRLLLQHRIELRTFRIQNRQAQQFLSCLSFHSRNERGVPIMELSPTVPSAMRTHRATKNKVDEKFVQKTQKAQHVLHDVPLRTLLPASNPSREVLPGPLPGSSSNDWRSSSWGGGGFCRRNASRSSCPSSQALAIF